MFRLHFLLIPLLLWTAELGAGVEIVRETFEGGTVELESIFGPATRSGALPYRLTISNRTGEDRTWTVTLREGNPGRVLSTEIVRQIPVAAGASAEHILVLPFAPEFTAYSYRNVRATISSPGIEEIARSEGYQTVVTIPTIAMSRALAARSLTRLDDEAQTQDSSNPRFADSFEPESLPSDWVAYTGIDVLMIDFPAWQALSPAQKRAVRDWIRSGGQLDLFLTTAERSRFGFDRLDWTGLQVDGKNKDNARLSLGTITLREWDGRELDTQIVSDWQGKRGRAYELGEDFDNSWALASDFGTKDPNSPLIFLLLIAFAILVAPINLFVFAKPGRRHRLFVTTPLISLGACLLIVMIIFLGDGLGGRGYRIVFADLLGDGSDRKLYLTQQQISRTGVMLSQGFEKPGSYSLDPVNLPPSPFNFLNRNRGSRGTVFRFDEANYSGGFFRSRSEQGYNMHSVEPTRARIEVRPPSEGDTAPTIVSSFPATLDTLYYRDPRGTTWRTPESARVVPGTPVTLVQSSRTELTPWLNTSTDSFSTRKRNRIRNLANSPDRFFATTEQAGDLFLETHPGIRWEKETLLLSGVVERKSDGPPGRNNQPESETPPVQ